MGPGFGVGAGCGRGVGLGAGFGAGPGFGAGRDTGFGEGFDDGRGAGLAGVPWSSGRHSGFGPPVPAPAPVEPLLAEPLAPELLADDFVPAPAFGVLFVSSPRDGARSAFDPPAAPYTFVGAS